MELDKTKQTLEQAFALPPGSPVKNVVEQTAAGELVLVKESTDSRVEMAKIVYDATENVWQIHWMAADGAWQPYGARDTLDAVIEVIREDPGGVFWG